MASPAPRRTRVLFVSRTRYRLPLNESLAQKWSALEQLLELRVLACSDRARDPAPPFVFAAGPGRGKLSAWLFWLLLPGRLARQLRSFRPDAVIAQSPYEAAAALLARRLLRSPVKVICEVQGDWRSASRLYGAGTRATLSPLADAVAQASLRRVDAVRTISPYTSRLVGELGIEPAATFPTFVDLRAFTRTPPCPPPPSPLALFVGVLEPYKNIDGLAAAWPEVLARVPHARLHIVGEGTLAAPVERLAAAAAGSVRWTPRLDAEGVAGALDEATLLVLPSRSEGMGRVVIEAFCRARPVVGARVGGIPDLVTPERNGLLVAPGDRGALVEALVRLLGDPGLAAALGDAGHDGVTPWLQTPLEFAEQTRALVETVAFGGRSSPLAAEPSAAVRSEPGGD